MAEAQPQLGKARLNGVVRPLNSEFAYQPEVATIMPMSIENHLSTLVSLIKNSTNPETEKQAYLESVRDFILDCADYLRMSIELDTATEILTYDSSEGRLFDLLSKLRQSRESSYTSLCNSVLVMNHLCAQFNIDPVCTENPNARLINSLAAELVSKYFVKSKTYVSSMKPEMTQTEQQ